MCMPVLNLLNFELPTAAQSKYVLTSPRSLKACRKAGIRPTELLYRSFSDVLVEVGRKEDARILFEAHEAERQRKLAVCRALRNDLLLNGTWTSCDLLFKTERDSLPSRQREGRDHSLPNISKSTLWASADTPENLRKTKESPETPKSPMCLPKVGIVFDKNAAGRLEKKDPEQDNYKNNSAYFGKEGINKLDISGSTINCGNKEEKKTPELFENGDTMNDGKKNSMTLSDLELFQNAYVASPNDKHKNREKENMSQDQVSCSQSPKVFETEDINNNNIEINTNKKKLSSSATKRKSSDKKNHSKILDHKKAFQNMKIQYSDPEYCTYKYKQVIENSVGRDLREIDVQRAQRELDAGMERWQDRVLLLQWLDAARAMEQVSRELETKVERLQQKNRSRNIIHAMNINKVREAEDMKAEGLRKQVEDKKVKILTLQQEKERVISECKNRAISIQELKEHIRSIETPETFDQKVAKWSIHKKVLTSNMCARTMQRSHIWLG